MKYRITLIALIVLSLSAAAYVLIRMTVENQLPITNPSGAILSFVALALLLLFIFGWLSFSSTLAGIEGKHNDDMTKLNEKIDLEVSRKIDKAVRHAQTISEKLATLADEHPWVVAMTQNDIFPDSTSCRMALRTAEFLVAEGRKSLAHEYLFSWVRPPKLHTRSEDRALEGSVGDFISLASFCEDTLADPYLATLMLKAGVDSTKALTELVPLLLRQSVRQGLAEQADQAATFIEKNFVGSSIILWSPRLAGWLIRRRPHLEEAALALAVHSAYLGDEKRFHRFIGLATAWSVNAGGDEGFSAVRDIALVEGMTYLGHSVPAAQVLSTLAASAKGTDARIQSELEWISTISTRYPGNRRSVKNRSERQNHGPSDTSLRAERSYVDKLEPEKSKDNDSANER